MRITSPMISNRMLLNINRNALQVDKLYNQLSAGKKVIFPSDDPILAARTVKFRTSVSETEQYQRNVGQGLSWMEITEGAFKNVTSIVGRIRELLVQGASDENSFEDRKKIIADIDELVNQLGAEMNVSYAGRYVFSGYRTDQPPIIQKDDKDARYNITQYFSGSDIEKMELLQSVPMGGGTHNEFRAIQSVLDATTTPPTTQSGVYALKLAYKGDSVSSPPTLTFRDPALYDPDDPNADIVSPGHTYTSVATANNLPATIGPNEVYYIEETGTLVMGKEIMDSMSGPDGYTLDVNYDKEGLKKGDLNPVVYFDCTDLTTVPPKSYDMKKQDFELEFGSMTRIKINSLAKDVYTDKMYADLKDFINVFTSLSTNTLDSLIASGLTEAAAKEVLQSEEDMLRKMSHDRFNNMLGLLDTHNAGVLRHETNMGSRMSRLELIEKRLEEDRLNFKALLSYNEDVDYTEAAMDLHLADTVYKASLQVGAKIMQLTLADYIR